MEAVLVGLGLGTAAGISPGPLLVLVVTAALRSGWRSAVVSACAPLLTDVLVIAGVLLVLGQLPERSVGWLALVGAVFVAWTGLRTVAEARTAHLIPGEAERATAGRRALREAALVNLLSPHPWVFWATVLGPLTLATWHDRPPAAVALVAGFYLAIVAAKAVIGVLAARLRNRLSDRGYRIALTLAGVLLIGAAAALVLEFLPVAAG